VYEIGCQYDVLLHTIIKSTDNYYNQHRSVNKRTCACACISASLKEDGLVGS
jgi:hypothetical protein